MFGALALAALPLLAGCGQKGPLTLPSAPAASAAARPAAAAVPPVPAVASSPGR